MCTRNEEAIRYFYKDINSLFYYNESRNGACKREKETERERQKKRVIDSQRQRNAERDRQKETDRNRELL